MRLVVELGEGIPDANSYISEDYALNHLPSMQAEEWLALSFDDRIDRLVTASQFIDISYPWVGKQKTLDQGLSWPREGVMYQGHEINPSSIPIQIKRAVIMALLQINELGLDIFQSSAELTIKREKMAVFETEYFEPGKQGLGTVYADINNLLRGFYALSLGGGVQSSEVVRV